MEFKAAQNILQKLTQRSTYLIGLSACLLVCNVILGSLLWYQSSHQQVILVPMGFNKAALISPSQMSASYIEQCALFFVNARLNVTPETIAANEGLVLRHTAAHYRSEFKKALLKEQQVIQSQKIASTFYPSQVKVDASRLQVWVKGTLKRWVGEKELQATQKSYVLSFQALGSELRLSGFQAIDIHQEDL